MHSYPDRDNFFVDHGSLLCAKIKYLQTQMYVFTTRSVARQSWIVAQLTATTVILSRMCRQFWVGTFGICRSQASAPIPMQTNTLGTSRCTDRYFQHMQTSAPSQYKGPVMTFMVLCCDLRNNFEQTVPWSVKRDALKLTWLRPNSCSSDVSISQMHHYLSWWRHQMETFSALLAIRARISSVTSEFPHKGQWCTALIFDLRLNKRLSKQSWGWWFETRSHPLRRHSNVLSPNRWVTM